MNAAPDQVKEDVRFKIVSSLNIVQRDESIPEHSTICEEVCSEDFPLLRIGVQGHLDHKARV